MAAVDLAFVLIVGLPALLGVVAIATTLRGMRAMDRLRDVDLSEREWPPLSIVVPACDEERTIEAAVRTMLAQDYPDLQMVVVDDRSTDRTGEIVDRIAAADDRVVALHLTELPDGWLGKLNALDRGVRCATGAWLLFADADAHLSPSTLRRAVAHAQRQALDLLTVFPHIESAGFVGDAVFAVTQATFSAATRPWAIRDPRSTAIAATGAFILVRREAFERTPGFSWLRLEVADDFGLALMIKTHGGTCDIVNGAGDVSILWYASFGEMTRLIQKNLYAILGRFSVARLIVQALALLWLGAFPLAALLPVTEAPLLGLVPLGLALWIGAAVVASRATGRAWLPALLPQVGFLAMAWLVVRSAVVGVRTGGIVWRGVRYPTALLRHHQRVRF